MVKLLLQVSHDCARALSRTRSVHSVDETEEHAAALEGRGTDYALGAGVLRLSLCGVDDSTRSTRPWQLRQLFLSLVFIKLFQKPVNVLLLQIVGCRQPQLVGVAAADSDLVRLPQPVLQIHARNGRDVHANNRAAQGGVGRRPGFAATFLHFIEDVVSELAMAALDAV